jgi:hypothetical protein
MFFKEIGYKKSISLTNKSLQVWMSFVIWALPFPKSMNFVTVQKRIQKNNKNQW